MNATVVSEQSKNKLVIRSQNQGFQQLISLLMDDPEIHSIDYLKNLYMLLSCLRNGNYNKLLLISFFKM